MIRTLAAALSTTVCLVALATPAQAQTRTFNIPAGSLKSALDAYARASGRQIIYKSDQIRSKNSQGALGAILDDTALESILKTTGMTFRRDASGAIAIVRSTSLGEADAGSAAARDESADIVVTGSRVKGAPPTSPVIRVTQTQIKEAGFTDLGQVVRSIPQNFGGGQNPTVSFGASGIANQNLTSASAVNLRGLGPDATLTLMNGHRLAYDSFTQAVDISVIPVDAVDSIEIVADGASALYGSDAVGGVVNVKVKRDYDGLSTTARVAAATEGGDFQQQYSVVAGTKWTGGGVIATYDFGRDTAIEANQRSYTKDLLNPNQIINPQKHNSFLVSAHQELGAFTTFSIDGIYTDRRSHSESVDDYDLYAARTKSQEYAVSPTLTFSLPAGWTASLNGVYAVDNAQTPQDIYNTSGLILEESIKGCYCNKAYSGEAGAEGALFNLPGGPVRVAIGLGYRDNKLYQTSITTTSNSALSASRHSYYAYSELFLPLFSPEQNIPFINRLTINIAARHERYGDLGNVTTPKFGFVYAPASWLDLKGSWGKSYKAPTLLQEYEAGVAYLFPVTSIGGDRAATAATALVAYGGNRDLAPERATTWSVTAAFHPARLSGLNLEASYFNINYRNRVVQPIILSQALSNQAYVQFLTANPTVAQQAAVIAGAATGITNYTGSDYNPASVAWIVNDLYTNVARQHVHGVDISGTYKWAILSGIASITGDASWLDSNQRNSNAAPTFTLAGTAFNPPHVHGRAGATFEGNRITLSSFLNYIGSVTDERTTTHIPGHAMATVDLTAIYRLPISSGLLGRTELSLSIQNVGDKKPPLILATSDSVAPFDSTNYSPIGRLISFSIRKAW